MSEKWYSLHTNDKQTTIVCLLCKEMAHIHYPCNLEEWEKFMARFDRQHRTCRDKKRKEK